MDVGVLVIGLGQIGMGYDLTLDADAYVYSHCRAFYLHAAFRLLGAVDPDEAKRVLFEGAYQQCAYHDVEAALDILAPELIVIAVPTIDHLTTLKTILNKTNPKVILCEKPLSYDLGEAACMVEMCQHRGVQLFVNYIRRSDPGVIDIKRKLDAGIMHRPMKGVVWYTKGFMHNGSHFFNLLEYWLGEMRDFHLISLGSALDHDDYEVDVKVSFEHGEILFSNLKAEHYVHYTIELFASNGMLRYEKAGYHITWQPVIADPILKGSYSITQKAELLDAEMHRFQYNVADQIALVFRQKDHFLSDGEDALRTIKSLSAILGSIRNNE